MIDKIVFDCTVGWLSPTLSLGSSCQFGGHDPSTVKRYHAKTNHFVEGLVLLCQYQVDNGGWMNGYNTLTLVDSLEPLVAVVSERPCNICAHMNDINVKVCWWCGNTP